MHLIYHLVDFPSLFFLYTFKMASRRGAALIAPLAQGIARPRNLSTLSRPLRTKLFSPHSSSRAAIGNYLIPSVTTAQRQHSVRYASDVAHDLELAQTPLYDLHLSYGAKIVPFGGYAMPVLYKDLSLVESHNWTREKASLFDVSHMYVTESNCTLNSPPKLF